MILEAKEKKSRGRASTRLSPMLAPLAPAQSDGTAKLAEEPIPLVSSRQHSEASANVLVSTFGRLRSPRKRKAKAIHELPAMGTMPSPQSSAAAIPEVETDPPLPQPSTEGDGGGHRRYVTHEANANPIPRIINLQQQRIATVKMQLRINNQCRSLARSRMGWRLDLPEADRKRINTAAEQLVKRVQEGEIDEEYAGLVPYIMASANSRKAFDDHRLNVERQMKSLAKLLPVWPWVESVHGFGAMGLAIIVGEAGDLSQYANPAKLWKRMGLAVINGRSQRKVTDADEAVIQGYNPRRRSAMYTIGDAIVKAGGPYRAVYDERKAAKTAQHASELNDKGKPVWPPIRLHRDAQRYMEKRLLRDLWRAWRDTATN